MISVPVMARVVVWVVAEAALAAVSVLGAGLVLALRAPRRLVVVVRIALVHARLFMGTAGIVATISGARMVAVLHFIVVVVVVARFCALIVHSVLLLLVVAVGIELAEAVGDITLLLGSLLWLQDTPVWVVAVVIILAILGARIIGRIAAAIGISAVRGWLGVPGLAGSGGSGGTAAATMVQTIMISVALLLTIPVGSLGGRLSSSRVLSLGSKLGSVLGLGDCAR
jgi:hypothetical protein